MSTIVQEAKDLIINQNTLSSELTEFANSKGNNKSLHETLNFFGDPIPISRFCEYKQADPKLYFRSENDDIRVSGSNFKYLDVSGKSVPVKTFNKGLAVRVDVDDISGNNWQTRYVYALQERILRNELRRTVQLILENATDAGALTWNDKAAPDADMRGALMKAGQDNGFFPNHLLYSESAWFIRQNSYAKQNVLGAGMAAGATRETLAELLHVDEIRLLKQNDLGLQELMKENYVFAFYAGDSMLKDDLSNIKRFVTLSPEGNLFQVYLEEHAKFTDIIVECYMTTVIPCKTNLISWKVKAA